MEVAPRYKLLVLCLNCSQYLDCLHCLHHCIYCLYFSNCFLHCWIPLSIRIPHIEAVGPKLNFSSHGNRCLVVRPPRQASIRLMQILLWAPELPPYLLVWLGRLLHIGRGPTSPCWTWNIFGTWVGHQKILALRSISKNIGKFERCWLIHVNYTNPSFKEITETRQQLCNVFKEFSKVLDMHIL